MRDMSEKQFNDALKRYGMRAGVGIFGYVNLNIPGHHIEASGLNGGDTRRGQLAYLLKQRECNCGHIAADHQRLTRDESGKLIARGCSKCDCSERML